ncbi:unnamed protein product [Rangifer tarandus platyrhynchus]|uniref:Uncharacterized protein n=1 Tax=Rangifer tarandus platyrhynchus TaxID=3082113 RepID=A0AC59ZWB3_RANTA
MEGRCPLGVLCIPCLSPGARGERGAHGEKGELGQLHSCAAGDCPHADLRPPDLRQDLLPWGRLTRRSWDLQGAAHQGALPERLEHHLPARLPALTVLCDMDTDGGGAVFQGRRGGSVGFFRTRTAYKQGFGGQLGKFWPGNDNIHALTARGTSELWVDLVDFEGNHRFAKHQSIRMAGEAERHQLVLGAFVEGSAGDFLTDHRSHFSTKHRDSDEGASSCAVQFQGAWWHHACHLASLNGRCLEGQHTGHANGINWKSWGGYNYSCRVRR